MTPVATRTITAPVVRAGAAAVRPKILHVLEATSAGAARYTADLLLRMDTEEFDVSFAYSPIRADARFMRDLSLIQARGIRTFEIQMQRSIRPLDDGKAFLRLYRLLKEQRFDLVHGHSSKAGFLGRLAAKLADSSVVTVYSPHAMAISANRVYGHLERFAGFFTDVMLGVSRSERDELQGYSIMPSEKLRYVTAGIDLPSYAAYRSNREFRKKIGVPEHAVLIGTAGRIAHQKDPFTFIRAAAQLHGPQSPGDGPLPYFAWAGDGDLRPQAEQLAQSLGIADRMRFLGYCSEIRPFLASLDVFALTSRYESFGYVTCEAMAMGKPVVATSVTGTIELVADGETGYLFETGDTVSCAGAFRTLAANASLRHAMGEAGRTRVNNYYDVRRMVRQVEHLYRELLEA